MSNLNKQTITTRQAKNQVNTFGLSLFIYICLIQTVWHGAVILNRFRPDFFGDADPILVMMLFNGLMMLFTAFVLFRISAKQLRLRMRDYLHKVPMPVSRKFILLILGIAIYVLTGFVATIFPILRQDVTSAYSFVGDFSSVPLIINNAVYFILFVCIKPLCDEYIFRGIIQRQLGHYSRYFGVLASAVLYALAQPTIADAVIAFFLGWYLAIISLRYHSIRPSLQIHTGIVFFSWIMSVIPQRFTWISATMIMVVFLGTGFVLIGRRVNTDLLRLSSGEEKLWKIVFTSFTVIMCIAVFLIGIILSMFHL